MPRQTDRIFNTPTELLEALAEFPAEARVEALNDILVPTPQEQSAARKAALLQRARELGIDVRRDLPRVDLTDQVRAEERRQAAVFNDDIPF